MFTPVPIQQRQPASESVRSPRRRFTRSQRQSNLRSLQSSSMKPQPSTEDPHKTIRLLTKELEYTRVQRDAAETHAVQAQREAAVWKCRFNKKKAKAKEPSRRIHMSSRVTTNEQGLREAEQDRQKKEEKKQKESEKQRRKEEKKKDDLVRRATQGSTMVFSGSLSSKNKTELEDIASALSLPVEGTKAILISQITAYFDQHPRFKEDDRYSGLFERSRGRKRTSHDENDTDPQLQQPPLQRHRFSPPPAPNVQPFANTTTYNQPLPNMPYPS